MAKKMKIPSMFKNKEPLVHQWQWPSCKHPKTLSFRGGDDMFKTVNSVYFDPLDEAHTPESFFTSSSESRSFSSESECTGGDQESIELIIRGVVRSERLFFEPGDTSLICSILEDDAKNGDGDHGDEVVPFKESVALAMESEDPYVDFKRSMEEMVESNGLKDWDCLEELLGWYLKMNGKTNHGFIVGAFLDLLVEIGSSSCSSNPISTSQDDSTSFSSAASSFSSPSSSPLATIEEFREEENIVAIRTVD